VDRKQIIAKAIEIAEQYRDEYGLTLSLRQLYYQFVARGLLPNGDRVYKRLGATLSAARLSGAFPIDFLEDRSRSVGRTDAANVDTIDEAFGEVARGLSSMPFWLRYGRWHGQPEKVFVWVEKEALAGVLHDTCTALGVGLFACKGYPSISALADWVRSTAYSLKDRGRQHYDEDDDALTWDKATIIYLGDHDPDGLQIPRSAEETIRQIMEVEGLSFDFSIECVALTAAQIAEHNPPPMVAKTTSARYARYKQETGLDDAWELDALDPPVLQALVKDSVNRYFDPTIYAANQERVASMRVDLIERVCADPAWIEKQLRRNV